MKYFLDTEFIEWEYEGKPSIELLSIGIISEDGREFYRQNLSADFTGANDFVKQNVIPQLERMDAYEAVFASPMPANREQLNARLAGLRKLLLPWCHYSDLKEDILNFIGDEKPEFWGYYADYDWVVFCWIFGRMIDLPKGWPMYCRDLKQLADSLGNPELPPQIGREHHAMSDARWNRAAFNFLAALPSRLSESVASVHL